MMASYIIPCGKHKGKVADTLSDNILAGLVWAYSQKRAGNDEIHQECFAVLYERHGTAKAVVELVDKFAEWAGSSKQPKRKTKTKKKKPKILSPASEDPNRVLFSMVDKDIYVPRDVVIGPPEELPPF